MKIPFRLLHLVVTCIAAGVMALYPAAWADEEKGYWQLERAVLVRAPKLDFPDYRVIPGIIPNGMQNKIEFKQNNQVYNQQIVRFGWTPIPQVLIPGQPVNLTIEVEFVYQPKDFGYTYKNQMYVVAQRPLSPDNWMNAGDFRATDGSTAIYVDTVPETLQGMTKSLNLSFTFAPGLMGDQVSITVAIEHNVGWYWRYEYRFRGGEPPAVPGHPIPAGMEWVSAG